MRIAIYARVSKNDESQDPQNQLNPLRNYAKALGGEIVSEYVDLASGGNGEREGFINMLNQSMHFFVEIGKAPPVCLFGISEIGGLSIPHERSSIIEHPNDFFLERSLSCPDIPLRLH